MVKFIVPYGGERLDRIARSILGSERTGSVEASLTANPGLAYSCQGDGTVPQDTVISIPDDFAPLSRSAGIVLAWE